MLKHSIRYPDFKTRIENAIAQIQSKPTLTQEDYRQIYPAIARNPSAWRAIAERLLNVNFLTVHQTRLRFAEKVCQGAISSADFLDCIKKYLSQYGI